MKILYILAGARFGGAEVAFVDMCRAVHAEGQTIEVVTRYDDVRVPKLREAGIKVHALPFRKLFDGHTARKLDEIIKKFQPQIVQTWREAAANAVKRWSPDMGIPRYLVVSRIGGYYKFKNFANTDYFVAITPDIKRYLVEDCGVQADKVIHINNFTSMQSKSAAPVSRAYYGIPEHATLCLGLGILHDNKGFDTLIWAISQLPDVYLWIAGEGVEHNALKSIIRLLNLEDRVTLLGWRTDQAALFEAADICVVSSRKEPFGSAFIQSWGYKTPLIATDSKGPRQYVHDGEDCMVIPIDDTRIMARSIEHLAEDKALQARFIETGYDRYLHEFTKEKVLAQYFEFYSKVSGESETLAKAV